MKLAAYRLDGRTLLGVVEGEEIIDLSTALGSGAGMADLITEWDSRKPEVERAAREREILHRLTDVQLAAPVARPGKIMCIGLNYADHIAESGLDRPEFQTWFCKTGNTVNGPYDPIPLPRASDKLDYEAELVAVIGKRGRHISRAHAPEHVFGYCVGNDLSVRDWQLRTSQFILGKSFDGHAPFGPWLTTADEVGDPHTLGIRCLVNGEVRQSSSTAHLVFNLWDMIEHVSQAMTLEPGDLIFTGTPGGVGWAMKPPQTLKDRDVVRCEIDRLGAIEGAVQQES